MNIVDNTIALFHFNDPENPLKDELGNLTWAINSGSTSITVDAAKFDKCMYLSYINMQSSEFKIEKDLTVDFWMYNWGIYTDYLRLFSINEVSTHYSYQIIKDGGSVYSSRYNGDPAIYIQNFKNNTLLHIAFVSDSSTGTCRWYINGKLSCTNYYCMNGGNIFLGFGTSYNNDRPGVGEYIDELRVSNCVRYTNNFIPSDKPYNICRNNKLFDQDKSIYGYGIV